PRRGRRDRGPRAPARRTALERRHELHAGARRREGTPRVARADGRAAAPALRLARAARVADRTADRREARLRRAVGVADTALQPLEPRLVVHVEEEQQLDRGLTRRERDRLLVVPRLQVL